MDRASVEARGKLLRTRIRETWGDLTDEDLDRFETNRSRFVGQVQERYGLVREDVERRLREIDLDDSEPQGRVVSGTRH